MKRALCYMNISTGYISLSFNIVGATVLTFSLCTLAGLGGGGGGKGGRGGGGGANLPISIAGGGGGGGGGACCIPLGGTGGGGGGANFLPDCANNCPATRVTVISVIIFFI